MVGVWALSLGPLACLAVSTDRAPPDQSRPNVGCVRSQCRRYPTNCTAAEQLYIIKNTRLSIIIPPTIRLLVPPSKLSDVVDALPAAASCTLPALLMLLLLLLLPPALLDTFDLSPEKILFAMLLTVGDFFMGINGFLASTVGARAVVPLFVPPPLFSSNCSRLFRKSACDVVCCFRTGFSIAAVVWGCVVATVAPLEAATPLCKAPVMSRACFSNDFR